MAMAIDFAPDRADFYLGRPARELPPAARRGPAALASRRTLLVRDPARRGHRDLAAAAHLFIRAWDTALRDPRSTRRAFIHHGERAVDHPDGSARAQPPPQARDRRLHAAHDRGARAARARARAGERGPDPRRRALRFHRAGRGSAADVHDGGAARRAELRFRGVPALVRCDGPGRERRGRHPRPPASSASSSATCSRRSPSAAARRARTCSRRWRTRSSTASA